MGFKEFQVNLDQTSDASFRAWVAAYLQGWADAGWTRASDSGQIDVVTVAKPTILSTAAGYAMFRFNDALQASAPIFIKVEFGTGTGAGASHPAMWLSVAKSTNGAGVLSGILLPRVLIGTRATFSFTSNGSWASIASSGPGYIAFLSSVDDPATAGTAAPKANSFIVERARQADGTPSASGLMVAFDSTGTTRSLTSSADRPAVRAINYSDGAYTEGIPPVSIPYSINGVALGPGTSLAAGSIGPVFPWVLIAPGLAPWQSCVMLCIPSGDYPSGVFETTLCGTRATFRAVPASVIQTWGVATSPTGTSTSGYVGPAIRWED